MAENNSTTKFSISESSLFTQSDENQFLIKATILIQMMLLTLVNILIKVQMDENENSTTISIPESSLLIQPG